ncbi:hypothetical protein [Rhodanobacter lindaniclasticus]|uniref:Uncharacterized protein n=1 Tax=Rhodanobacter lindaniclasticus TaxID=75310 RepID=A0A4S3KCM2_9GAMM|nr:hypothetical protein [Rhodanobacter lindaniclasticus]THD06119.1 hypothetical protein B1991_14345 [Rhodanobacter lindaniclasticus]
MTNDELTDQAAADLIRCYVRQDVMAMLVRTRGTEVSIICPNGDKMFMAALLRAAAKSLDEPDSKRVN